MPRVKRGTLRSKHKKIRQLTKGYRTIRHTRIKKGREALTKAMAQSYRDRRVKKRNFRQLWITRLNAAVREHGWKYSEFIKKITDKKIGLDRKVMAQLAAEYPEVFKAVLEEVRK
jgi:large subunit ribosomal protein L20